MDYKDIIVSGEMNIRSALEVLDKTAKKVIFIDSDGVLIGALTDGDVRRWILKNGDLNEKVSNIMNKSPITVTTDSKDKAHQVMLEKDITAVPCVDKNGRIINIFFLSEKDDTVTYNLDTEIVIMAGGKGERLLPYTKIVPKPLIPIGDKPIIELIIDRFKKFGCKSFILSINYKKNMLKAYFDESDRDFSISYLEEDKPLGTGGALAFLKGRLNKTFFVSNCDVLLDADYEDVYHKHINEKNIITIITSLKGYTIPYGIINTNEKGEVVDFFEKPTSDYLINTGVYVIEPEALTYLEENEFLNLTDLIERCMRDNKKVGTYPISEKSLLDMGQFEDLERMKNELGL